jgi:hypothetical protein
MDKMATMFWFTQNIKYRMRYYRKKLNNFFGYCPCGSRTNTTRTGRHICPSCGR